MEDILKKASGKETGINWRIKMFFRTISTYFTVVTQVVFRYWHTSKADRIMQEKGELEAEVYTSEIVADICRRIFKKTGAELIVTGLENIPKDKNFVLIANHQSMVDVFAIMQTINRPIGFIAKAELKKVPVLRKWMSSMGCIFMNRSDLRESMQALLEGIKKVKNGYSLCIFPEGTRTDGEMLEFKGGSFKLATKSGAPILPLTIDGTHRVLEDNKFWIKGETIRLTYHPIIETKGLSKEEQNALPERVQSIVGSALKEGGKFGKDKDTCC